MRAIPWIVAFLVASTPAFAQKVVDNCPAMNQGLTVGSQSQFQFMDKKGNLCTSSSGGSSPVAPSITWTTASSASVTGSATIVPAGPTTIVLKNTTTLGGGRLSVNPSGAAAVDGQGLVLNPGDGVQISGQSATVLTTAICSTGTCNVSILAGS